MPHIPRALLLVGTVALISAPAASSTLRVPIETLALVPPAELSAAIDHSAHYLARACGSDGQFIYRVHLDPSVKQREKYNLLRHAGAIYALTQYHQYRADPEVRAAALRAAHFLRDCCVAPLANRPDLLAIWSDSRLTRTGKARQAKLGGTGLGLVALVRAAALEPGLVELERLRALGRFLLYMQKADGSFYSKYIPSEGGRWDQWQSLYYPGEAALALTLLYERDPHSDWIQGATRALLYLARSRRAERELPPDHWALLATASLFAVCRDACPPASAREELVQHAVRLVESFLGEQLVAVDPLLAGSFTRDGRTTPTATRLEGLLAALSLLPHNERTLRARVEAAIHAGVGFLLRAHVSEGSSRGAMPRAIRALPSGNSLEAMMFNFRASEVRIDYVQHALSAMIHYRQLLSARSLPAAQVAP